MNDAQEPWGQSIRREFTLMPSVGLRPPHSTALTAHVERIFSALSAELALVVLQETPALSTTTNKPLNKGNP